MGPDKRVQSLFDCFQNTTESDVLGLKKMKETRKERDQIPVLKEKKNYFGNW